jgi:hypothetical protein
MSVDYMLRWLSTALIVSYRKSAVRIPSIIVDLVVHYPANYVANLANQLVEYPADHVERSCLPWFRVSLLYSETLLTLLYRVFCWSCGETCQPYLVECSVNHVAKPCQLSCQPCLVCPAKLSISFDRVLCQLYGKTLPTLFAGVSWNFSKLVCLCQNCVVSFLIGCSANNPTKPLLLTTVDCMTPHSHTVYYAVLGATITEEAPCPRRQLITYTILSLGWYYYLDGYRSESQSRKI